MCQNTGLPVTYYLHVFEAELRLVVEQLRSIQSNLRQASRIFVNFSINLHITDEVKSCFLILNNLSKAIRF